MLENIAAQILNRYIGKYVEDINTRNLSIGLLQGAVELENLPLKKDALNDLNLPGIVLKSGHIGKVVLRIASYKTIKEPWVIEIHNLALVVGPGESSGTLNKDAEKKKKDEKKQEELRALEEKWRAQHGQSASLYSVWFSYSSSIITTILENIQFEVHNLHMRYEDDKTLPQQQYACGVCIKNLTTKSTDENWIPTTGAGTTIKDMMYKLLQLDGFAIYWDAEAEMVGHLPFKELEKKLQKWSEPDLNKEMKEGNENEPEEKGTSQFLLNPVCGEAKLTKNCSAIPLRSKNQPRLSLDVLLGEISLHMGQTQYRQATSLMSELTRSEKREMYKEGRPPGLVRENPQAWWRWAAENHLKQIRRARKRSSKSFLVERARNNVSYVNAYRKVIYSKVELHKLTAAEMLTCEKTIQGIEGDMSFDEIRVLRELAYEKADAALKEKKTEKAKEEKTMKKREDPGGKSNSWRWGSWLGGWGRGWQSKKNEEENKEKVQDAAEEDSAEKSMEKKDVVDMDLHDSVYVDLNEDELYEMFGEELADQDTNDTFLKRDSVLLRLNFTLHAGTLSLYEDRALMSGAKLKSRAPLVGVEFRDVSAATEWRPRYKSNEIKMDLGGLYVRDSSNVSSHFADLIRPQAALLDSAPQSPRDESKNMSSSIKGLLQILSPNKPQHELDPNSTPDKTPVFSLLYQSQPRSSTNQFTNRLELVTAPLCLTFLPNLMDRVKSFFKSKESVENLSEIDDGFSAAARDKYEAWKLQSQAEIQRTVRRMMEGKTTTSVSLDRWAVSLNISAPEVIIPENVSDPNSKIVIINLGHMTFKNHNEDDHLLNWKKKRTEEARNIEGFEEEDDFVTPPDTPPGEGHANLSGVAERAQNEELYQDDGQGFGVDQDTVDSPSQQRLNEKLFYERMYEKYQIHFADLQVLVAKVDDKWEATRFRGKGPHHLVEKFSVDILLERRIVPTFDPECPAVKVRGNLPHLTIHISHNKIHALFNCLDHFSTNVPTDSTDSVTEMASSARVEGKQPKTSPMKPQMSVDEGVKELADPVRQKSYEEKSMSKQLICQFSLNEVSILLEKNPTSILSVLDVYRIQTEFTKRPYDHWAVFSIHSLLLADTKQELGHDFELLLASHRNVKMDLGSGNILDSGTTSPNEVPHSPFEKNMNHPPARTKQTLSSVAKNLNQTIHVDMDTSPAGEKPLNPDDQKSASQSRFDFDDDLITVKWEHVGSPAKELPYLMGDIDMQTTKPSNHIDVKFNSLDLVLNLKTWVALLDFFHHLTPKKSKAKVPFPVSFPQASLNINGESVPNANSVGTSDSEPIVENPSQEKVNTVEAEEQNVDTVIFLEFYKLNILLMRHIETDDGKVIGRKVATLTMHDTCVNVTFDDQSSADTGERGLNVNLDVTGSVGSLGLQDLTNAVRDQHGVLRGMQVLILGEITENLDASASSVDEQARKDFRTMAKEVEDEDVENQAFSFNIVKGSARRSVKSDRRSEKDPEDLMFSMEEEEARNSAVQEEVSLNLHLASVLYLHTPRLVAEVLALVDEAGDVISAQMTSDTRQAYKDMAYSIMDKSIAVLGKSVHQFADVTDSAIQKSVSSESTTLPSLFKLTVDMQSPIVALPKCHGSFELLVANLGTITVKNDHALGRFDPDQDALDVLHISITEMSMTSKRQVDEELKVKKTPGISNPKRMTKVVSGPSLAKLKSSASSKTSNSSFNDIQILHDTSIKLTIIKKPFVPSPRNPLDIRKPKKGEDGILASDEVYDGPISDKRMCVDLQMTLPLNVTLSKRAYEQLLKTLDHISYGGNIDTDGLEELNETVFSSDFSSNIRETISLAEHNRTVLDTIASQQSTPSHNREFKLFSAPGLEISPNISQLNASKPVPITQRKYTPISAEISIPELRFQLSEDLSQGEQGVVKVTLEGFFAKFNKENRSTTELDLTLGSIDVEDLLKEENSPHRHIVLSHSISSHGFKSGDRTSKKTAYLSTSCPAFVSASPNGPESMSSSFPTHQEPRLGLRTQHNVVQGQQGGVFRPFDNFNLSSGPFGTSQAAHDHQTHRKSYQVSNDSDGNEFGAPVRHQEEKPSTPPSSPKEMSPERDATLVRIKAFLVDGKCGAYEDIYDRTNRRIDIDFNSLDCKINVRTWVVLLDFFGIGTAPKKTYDLDPKTEEELNWDKRLAVSSYYENQPDAHINSEIDFKVHSFTLIFNKEEYEFVKANISKFETLVRIRDGTMNVSGHLGSLSVLDISPNGQRYRERFVFAGQKAMDFDVEKLVGSNVLILLHLLT